MEKLRLLFEGVNLKDFCERYDLSYDYTRKVFKGTYVPSNDWEMELWDCFIQWHNAKTKIIMS